MIIDLPLEEGTLINQSTQFVILKGLQVLLYGSVTSGFKYSSETRL